MTAREDKKDHWSTMSSWFPGHGLPTKIGWKLIILLPFEITVKEALHIKFKKPNITQLCTHGASFVASNRWMNNNPRDLVGNLPVSTCGHL